MSLKEQIRDIIEQVGGEGIKGSKEGAGQAPRPQNGLNGLETRRTAIAEPSLDSETADRLSGHYTKDGGTIPYNFHGETRYAPVTWKYTKGGTCSYCGKAATESYQLPISGLVARRCNSKDCTSKFDTVKASE